MCLCCVCGVLCVCVCVSQGLIQLTCGGNLSLAFISTELAITCVRAGGRGVGGRLTNAPCWCPTLAALTRRKEQLVSRSGLSYNLSGSGGVSGLFVTGCWASLGSLGGVYGLRSRVRSKSLPWDCEDWLWNACVWEN